MSSQNSLQWSILCLSVVNEIKRWSSMLCSFRVHIFCRELLIPGHTTVRSIILEANKCRHVFFFSIMLDLIRKQLWRQVSWIFWSFMALQSSTPFMLELYTNLFFPFGSSLNSQCISYLLPIILSTIASRKPNLWHLVPQLIWEPVMQFGREILTDNLLTR